MTEIDDLKKIMAEAWSGKLHVSPLRGAFEAPSSVRSGGMTDTILTVAATAAQAHYYERLERMTHTIHELAQRCGTDSADMVEQEYLKDGDLT